MSDNSSVAKKEDDVNSLIKIPIRHECYNSLSIKDVTVDKLSEYETSLIKQDILRKSIPIRILDNEIKGLDFQNTLELIDELEITLQNNLGTIDPNRNLSFEISEKLFKGRNMSKRDLEKG